MSKNIKVEDSQTANLPAEVYDYGADAKVASGFEGVGQEHLLTPLLDIVQSGAPELNTMQGISPGMFICRALGMIWDGKNVGLGLVAVGQDYKFNEWKPRGDGTGGGFVAAHDPGAQALTGLIRGEKFGDLSTKSGNDIVETFSIIGIVIAPDGARYKMAIPFWSTKIKRFKSFFTKANALVIEIPGGRFITPPLYAYRYRLKTFLYEGGGFKWWGYTNIDFDGANAKEALLDPRGDLYQEARRFAEVVAKGEVKIDRAGAQPHKEDGGGHNPDADDDSPPF